MNANIPMPLIVPCSEVQPSFTTTHAQEVMCVVNTPKRQPQKPTKTKLPYEELAARGYGGNARGKQRTPIEEKQSERSRQLLNRELHNEHRTFMAELQRERQDRARTENAAAAVIQRAMRAFASRERKNSEKKTPQYSDDDIRRFILEISGKLDLPPVEGLILE